MISSLHMIFITDAARLSRAPPHHRYSHDTADTLSPRKSTVSPAYSGLSFSVICITNADIIIPINSSGLVVIEPAYCFVQIVSSILVSTLRRANNASTL